MAPIASQHDSLLSALLAASSVGPEALRILTSLRRIVRAVELHSRRLSVVSNVTAPQLVCLTEIARSGGISSRSLAKGVSLSASTLVGIIDRLEAKGLVERRRSAIDRRVVELHATAKGEEMVKTSPSPLQEVLLRNLGKMTDTRRGEIATALETIVRLMEVEEVNAEPFIEAGSNIDLQQDAMEPTESLMEIETTLNEGECSVSGN